jgi:hypothetical protein
MTQWSSAPRPVPARIAFDGPRRQCIAILRNSGETPIAAAAPLRPSCSHKRRAASPEGKRTAPLTYRSAPMIAGSARSCEAAADGAGARLPRGAPPPGPSRAFTQARSGQEDRAGGSQLIAWCGGRAGPSEVHGAAQPVAGYSGYSEHPEQPNAPGDAWRRPDVAHPRPAANHTACMPGVLARAQARKRASTHAQTYALACECARPLQQPTARLWHSGTSPSC